MSRGLRITRVRIYQYRTQTRDLGVDYNGFNSVYEPGVQREGQGYVIAIETDQGITGEYAGGDAPTYAQVGLFARYLLGRDALQRELIYNDVKRALRKQDRMGLGPVDIALWDIAGKVHQAPIWQLLGGWKTRLPAYASTYHGDENGGLDSPEAFADFAVQCRERGYPAFKIHGWGRYPQVWRTLLTTALDQVQPASPGGVGPIAPHHVMRRRGAMAAVRASPCWRPAPRLRHAAARAP
jgi:L-alanine-DL-glutamate epimerase-like enolase superfamily enzyme